MLDRIKKVFVEITGNNSIVITEKTKIDKKLGLSSLGVVQIICGIEDEFDVAIPNSVIKKLKTVGDLVKFLEDNT